MLRHAMKAVKFGMKASGLAGGISSAAVGGMAIHKAIKFRNSPAALGVNTARHFAKSSGAFKSNNVGKMLYHDHHVLAGGLAHRALGVINKVKNSGVIGKIKNTMSNIPKPPPEV